jgi:hypothetical protein
MAGMFHVFVEGAADGSPEGVARLAEAIARHYGLPAADLQQRLESGRFRVKGNVDRQTAETYVRDLERLGARCTIEEPSAANSRPTPLPFPAVRPATPPAGMPVAKAPLGDQPASRPSVPPSALGDQPASRPSAPPSALASYPRPATPPPAAGAFTSGLAAAFSPDAASSSGGLGALEREDATFSLSSVDGADEAIEKSPEPAFAPPAAKKPAAKDGAKDKAKDRPKDVPVDIFAPPDADSADLKVDIADDEKEFTRKKTATPPAGAPVEAARAATAPARAGTAPVRAATEPPRRSEPKIEGTVKASKLGPLADERVRLVAGVVLAILIGFLPAHLVAKSREASAYKEIDAQLISIQSQADTPDAYAALDHTRAMYLERKKDERRNIAMLALVIWGLVGAGVAYGWFRRIPWDEL